MSLFDENGESAGGPAGRWRPHKMAARRVTRARVAQFGRAPAAPAPCPPPRPPPPAPLSSPASLPPSSPAPHSAPRERAARAESGLIAAFMSHRSLGGGGGPGRRPSAGSVSPAAPRPGGLLPPQAARPVGPGAEPGRRGRGRARSPPRRPRARPRARASRWGWSERPVPEDESVVFRLGVGGGGGNLRSFFARRARFAERRPWFGLPAVVEIWPLHGSGPPTGRVFGVVRARGRWSSAAAPTLVQVEACFAATGVLC